MMDLEIWLDLAVGIIALGAIGFGAWVYFASQNGKEISIPKIDVKLPSFKPENEGEVRKRISGSVNRLLGREDGISSDYVVPEEESLIVPIKSTTLPSNRKLDLDDLYDKAKAFDEAEEQDADEKPFVQESVTPKVQLAVPVSPLPEKPEPIQQEILQEESTQEESFVEEPTAEEAFPEVENAEVVSLESSFMEEVKEEFPQTVVEETQEEVTPTIEEKIELQKEEQKIPEVHEAVVPVDTAHTDASAPTEEKKSFEEKRPIVKHPLHNVTKEQVEETPKTVVSDSTEEQSANTLPALQRADGGVPFSFAQFLLLIQTGLKKTVDQTKEKISQVTSKVSDTRATKVKPRSEYEAGLQEESGLKRRMKTIVKMVSSIFQRGVEKVQEKADLPRRVVVEDDMVEVAAQTTRNGRTPYLNFFKIDKIPAKENGVLLGLQNIGWTLKYERFEAAEHNQVSLAYRAPQKYSSTPATYPQGSLICFDITSPGKQDFVYHFKVIFLDKNGTTYSQEIYGQGVFPPVIKDPETLEQEEAVPERVS
ncbi:MAG: hypothetical protein AAFR66_04575 [Bacteroidota bacterium]